MEEGFALETDEQRKTRGELHQILDDALLKAESSCIFIIMDGEIWDFYGNICKDCVYDLVIKAIEDADEKGLLEKSSRKKH